ncbi:MAG: hypothetical protein O2892_09640 [Actinomycetota bacterium]|nr:hypothetical protein [Actinomycetota bacterium]MDA2949289.1 hypothetical protein [Actinomycetota bacterium]
MTQIEMMLNNVYTLGMRAGGGLLGIWGLYIFFKSLFGEGGRNPARIVVSVLMIVAAGAMFQLLPKLVEIGKDTGSQLGGGGYSMPAPAGVDAIAVSGLTVHAAL